MALLQPGLDWLEARTGKPVLGVLPYLHGLHLEAEDAIARELEVPSTSAETLRGVVPVTPRIANHTDFDTLRLHPHIDFRFVGPDDEIPPADLIILPGSKAVCADLAFLRQQGWHTAIARHLRYGGKLMGICGGFQMLGQSIADPAGIEGPTNLTKGLGYLDMHTTLAAEKQLRNVRGSLAWLSAPVHGYEIHAGVTQGPALARPATTLEDGPDGAISEDGQILGSYVHGIFDSPEACNAMLSWAGLRSHSAPDIGAMREASIERLADTVARHINTELLMAIIRGAA